MINNTTNDNSSSAALRMTFGRNSRKRQSGRKKGIGNTVESITAKMRKSAVSGNLFGRKRALVQNSIIPLSPALRRTLRFVSRNWNKPVSVKDLVAVSKMSTRGLAKAFVKNIGHGPGRELRRVRIQKAQKLLSNSSGSLGIIASTCGFNSVNSFWVAFRRETGMTPGKYRNDCTSTN